MRLMLLFEHVFNEWWVCEAFASAGTYKMIGVALGGTLIHKRSGWVMER